MRIQIDVRWPRFLRERPRWARLTIVGLVAAGVLAVPVAFASHQFTDVPTAHPFHADISAVKNTGITAGKTCVPPGTPPTYCPGESITREAMAAFLRRGLGRIDMDDTANAPDIAIEGTFGTTNLLTEDLQVGGVAGAQYVRAEGWFTIETDDNITSNCEVEARIVQDIGTANVVTSRDVFADISDSDGDVDQTVYVSWVFAAPSGDHTYTLQAGEHRVCNDTSVDNVLELSSAMVSAQSFPLNQIGDSDPFPPGQEPGESAGTAPSGSGPKEG
jgi:hypothetical protein